MEKKDKLQLSQDLIQLTQLVRITNYKNTEDALHYSLTDIRYNKKSPRGIGPRRFPLPLRVQNTLRSLKIQPKWCKFMKLVIYRTFDMFAPPPLPTSFLHPSPCDNMNP